MRNAFTTALSIVCAGTSRALEAETILSLLKEEGDPG